MKEDIEMNIFGIFPGTIALPALITNYLYMSFAGRTPCRQAILDAMGRLCGKRYQALKSYRN